MPEPLPLAAASARLRGQPGRPRTAPGTPPNGLLKETTTTVLAIPARLVDVTGAARYLGVAPDTIRDLDARRVLRRVRLPGPHETDLRRCLYDVRDLDTLIEQAKDAPKDAP